MNIQSIPLSLARVWSFRKFWQEEPNEYTVLGYQFTLDEETGWEIEGYEPKGNVRRAFTVKDDCYWVSLDFSAQELRIPAQLSGESVWLEVFKNHQDIHEQTALAIFGKSNHDLRKKAKAANFGIMYGMNARSLQEKFRMSREEHILLLGILQDPVKYDEETGNKVGKGGRRMTSISKIMRQLLPDYTKEQNLELVTVLENERLIQHIKSRYNMTLTDQGINHLSNTLTSKGMRFVVFISCPGSF